MSPWAAGASLYVPATRSDLAVIASGAKYPLRSAIFCTEDSVREDELPLAMANLAELLSGLEPSPMLRLLRVRNLAVLERILALPGVERLDGLVLPKFSLANLSAYAELLTGVPLGLMPTLETREVFDPDALVRLRDQLLESRLARQIISLRTGAQDLLSLLGLRRSRGRTIYETPVGSAIDRLVGIFKPYGLAVHAPVFDYLDDPLTLEREVAADLEHGLIGKSAVHPDQVGIIESQYRVSPEDLELAGAILNPKAPAVFQAQGAMCEPATHSSWAKGILERQRIFGCYN